MEIRLEISDALQIFNHVFLLIITITFQMLHPPPIKGTENQKWQFVFNQVDKDVNLQIIMASFAF